MSLSSSALIAQSGLNTVTAEASILARNITGASGTAEYSRKSANIISTLDGSQVASVTRASNLAVFGNMLTAASASAAQDALSSGLDMLDQTVGSVAGSSSSTASGSNSPAALLSNFTNALQSYEASPSNASLAAAAVSAASSLARGLNSASAIVAQVREQADSGIAASVQSINALLAKFQTVNAQILAGTATGADVTSTQDTRDNILTQLAREIGITTVTSGDGGMAIYTDSGAALFQGGVPRIVTFSATNTYTAATAGNPVFADGIPITGNTAPMPLAAGNIAGLAMLRDNLAVTYQTQLDGMAAALISTFAENDLSGPGPSLPGLFTTPGATSLSASSVGLADQISVNANADPSQGGNALLLRDGGISGTANPGYVYNQTGDASYVDRISQLLDNLSAAQMFSPAGGITASARLSEYASASVSWLEDKRSNVLSQSTYQSALLNTAAAALSNATGVNLDDEMSRMLDLERSYSATAKLISAIDGMFGALLANLG